MRTTCITEEKNKNIYHYEYYSKHKKFARNKELLFKIKDENNLNEWIKNLETWEIFLEKKQFMNLINYITKKTNINNKIKNQITLLFAI